MLAFGLANGELPATGRKSGRIRLQSERFSDRVVTCPERM